MKLRSLSGPAIGLCGSSLALAATAAAALFVFGCPPQPSGNDNTGEFVEVEMRGIAFTPKSVTIHVGETVRWTNRDPVSHTVTSGDPDVEGFGDLFNSDTLRPGDRFTHTFDEAGDFEYFCIPHQHVATMRHAEVIVEP